jgi:hypothetical protein
MQIAETVTGLGSGFWGYETYEIELSTQRTTYSNAAGTNSRTTERYELKFHSSSHFDIRRFASDRERAEFISKNFTQLELKSIPLSEQKPITTECPLTEVEGEYLSSVTFVMDYLQVGFCGKSFNFYNWPVIILGDRSLEIRDAGYRDALCGLIGKTVQRIDVFLDVGLTFKFQTGETMTVSLRAPVDSSMPEVAEYSRPKKSGIIWGSGEEPFE